MLVLIDESGCPGFKEKSSHYFILATVTFNDPEEATRASIAIDGLRVKSGFRREFKFSSCSSRIKDQFFDLISRFDFKVRVLVIDKRKIFSEELKSNHRSFYNYMLKNLLKHDNGAFNNATVIIDGGGSKRFRKSTSSYIKSALPKKKFKKIKFRDSKKDNLIQVADMVVSSIARTYHRPDANNSDRWRNVIKSKIENTWDFR